MKKLRIWLDSEPPVNQPANHLGILMPDPVWRVYHVTNESLWDGIEEYPRTALQFTTNDDGGSVFDAEATVALILEEAAAVDDGAEATYITMSLSQYKQCIATELYTTTFTSE